MSQKVMIFLNFRKKKSPKFRICNKKNRHFAQYVNFCTDFGTGSKVFAQTNSFLNSKFLNWIPQKKAIKMKIIAASNIQTNTPACTRSLPGRVQIASGSFKICLFHSKQQISSYKTFFHEQWAWNLVYVRKI